MIARRRYDYTDYKTLLCKAAGSLLANPEQCLERFEETMIHHLGIETQTPFSILCSGSGRSALAALLEACNLKGGSIMLPAYTLGDLAPFIRRLGYEVRLCDVDARRPLMTLESLERAWKPDVSCVLATHLFGVPCSVEEIRAFAHQRGAVVLEDCAHSLGSLQDGRPTGLLADGAIFSFDLLKPVNTFGGGMALAFGRDAAGSLSYRRREAVSRLRVLRKIATGLIEDGLFAGPWLRIPSGLLAFEATRPLMKGLDRLLRRPGASKSIDDGFSPLQALIGLEQVESLDERMKARRAIARRILVALDLEDPIYEEKAETRSNAYFVVLRAAEAENANSIRRSMWLAGIDAGVGAEVADDLGALTGESLPSAAQWYHRSVQVPCYESMSEPTLDLLCRKLEKFRGRLSI